MRTKLRFFLVNDFRTVEVGEDVGVCEPFKILGYQLSGEVKSPSSQPMSNVKVTVCNFRSLKMVLLNTEMYSGVLNTGLV